jgi:CheY-specific phosphatase CheX
VPLTDLGTLLTSSAGEVLESMFFTSAEERPGAEVDLNGENISAVLTFEGSPAGRFGLTIPGEPARKLAASFLGADEELLVRRQVEEVVCELANMLCGSVLSSLDKETRFDLTQPQIAAFECPRDAARRTFLTDEGPIAVWMALTASSPPLCSGRSSGDP